MPTYEYRCPKGHEFEEFQRMSDPPVAKCPECGAEAERLLSAGAGLIFKGSGFYITDYRDEGYKKAAAAENANGAGATGEKSATPKADAKEKSTEAAAPKPESKAKPSEGKGKKAEGGGKAASG